MDITTDVDNLASQGVIVGAGGTVVERFDYPPRYAKGEGLRYRILL